MKKLWIINVFIENWFGKWFLWMKILFICIYYNMNKKLVYNICIFVYIWINLFVIGELWYINLCFILIKKLKIYEKDYIYLYFFKI